MLYALSIDAFARQSAPALSAMAQPRTLAGRVGKPRLLSALGSRCARPAKGSDPHPDRGITLVELLVVVAMAVAVSAIAIPTYQSYMDDVRINNVRKDMKLIEVHLERFRTENGGSLPDTLGETAATTLTDPWGNPYQYLNIEDATGPGLGKVRKDKNLVPLNTDFDLYSMGEDGDSKPPLTAAASHDDVVRANNGAYVGLASDY